MAYYFTQEPWVDAKNMFAPWFNLNDFNNQGISPALTADGFPLTMPRRSPSGRTTRTALSGELSGHGDPHFGGMHAAISNQQYNAATDTTSYNLTINRQGDSLLVMNLVGVNPANPVHDLHISRRAIRRRTHLRRIF